jgi:hypothetical protein
LVVSIGFEVFRVLGKRGVGGVTLKLEQTLVGFRHDDGHAECLVDVYVATDDGIRNSEYVGYAWTCVAFERLLTLHRRSHIDISLGT